MGKRLYYTYNKIRKYAYFVAISAISGTITGACIQNNGIMATEFMVFMSSMIADIIAKSKISNIGLERFKIINARNYTLDKLVEYSSKYDLKILYVIQNHIHLILLYLMVIYLMIKLILFLV